MPPNNFDTWENMTKTCEKFEGRALKAQEKSNHRSARKHRGEGPSKNHGAEGEVNGWGRGQNCVCH